MDNQTVVVLTQAAFPNTLTEIDERHGDLKLRIPRESLLVVMQWLRDHAELQYTFLESVTGEIIWGASRALRWCTTCSHFATSTASVSRSAHQKLIRWCPR